jgi:hypothetical protein
MSAVFSNVNMSLDGYIAPDGMDIENANDPSYRDWLARWMGLQAWTFRQQFFRENLRLGAGGDDGVQLPQDRAGDDGLGLGGLEPVGLPAGQVPVAGGVHPVVLQASPHRPPGRHP